LAASVDAHVHVFRALSERYPRAIHPMFPPEMEAPVEDLLSTMDSHGIERAVLVPVSGHDEYVRDCLSSHGDRFAGIGVLERARSDDAADVRRRFSEAGIRGLRVHHLGHGSTPSVEDLETWTVLEALVELGGILWLYVDAEQLKLLSPVLDRLLGLRVVLNHLGWALPDEFQIDDLGRPRIGGPIPPPTLPTVLDLARYDTVHVMFSGEYAFSQEDFPYSDVAGVVRAIYEAYGADRMLWASDYPWIKQQPGYEPQLRLIDHYLPDISARERSAIMGRTAARLFDFWH
jgi:L-fuconolactonase